MVVDVLQHLPPLTEDAVGVGRLAIFVELLLSPASGDIQRQTGNHNEQNDLHQQRRLAQSGDHGSQKLLKLREACGGARLKVILETGAIPTHRQMWEASIIAMEAGADFIKTSTGKNCGGATPEAAMVMCAAIKAYAAKTGRKVGFKPAGGVSTAEEACLYYEIVRSTLGQEWLVNTLFRIGASRLANNLLGRILELKGRPSAEKFF